MSPTDFAAIPPGVPIDLSMPPAVRNRVLRDELIAGRIAPHLLRFERVEWVATTARSRRRIQCATEVSPDWIGVGSDHFYLRATLAARDLQAVADHYGAMLPTSRVVDAIHAAPRVIRCPFVALSPRPGESRDATPLLLASNASIESIRRGMGGLVTDGKKDVIVGPGQIRAPSKVAIYGAWYASGRLVQPSSTVHAIGYYDYSQCGRLVSRVVEIDGQAYDANEIAQHDDYHTALVSSRASGPLRYQ